MSIDKGELKYSIKIEDNFSAGIKAFIASIEEAKLAYAEFRTTGSVAPSSSGMQAFIAAILAAKAATVQQTAATEELNAAEQAEATAKRALTALKQRHAAAIDLENLAAEEGISLSKLRASVTSEEERAENKVAAAISRRRVEELAAQIAAKQGIEISAKKTAVLTDEDQIAKKLADTRARLQLLEKANSNDSLKQLVAEEEARKRVIAVEKEQAVAQQLLAQGRTPQGGLIPLPDARLLAPPAAPPATTAQLAQTKFQDDLKAARLKAATDEIKANSTEWQQLTKSTEEADSALGAVGQSLGRIVLAFVAFKIISTVVSGFKELVTTALEFNRTVESTSLGLGGVFLAVGQVTDATGATVKSTQAFALAQGEARRQTQLLRTDALNTRGTFEELVKVFKVAIAPGFQAGLNVDQIRELTLHVAEAATALGIQENQLASQIRQILSATITPRTNRLAASLGITNEDIKRSQEAGKLADFLQAKFSAFSLAGKQSINTFDGLVEKIKASFQEIIGLGTEAFFNSLKASLTDVLKILTVRDSETGLLKPNPEAIKFVKELTAGITEFLGIAHQVSKAIDWQVLFQASTVSLKALSGTLITTRTSAVGLQTVFDLFLKTLENSQTALAKIFSLFGNKVSDPKKAATGLSDAFSAIPAHIRDALTELEDTAAITRQLTADTKKSAELYAVGVATLQLGQTVLNERKTIAEAEFKAQQDSLIITQRLAQEQSNLVGIRSKAAGVAQQVGQLDNKNFGLVGQLVNAGQAQLKAEEALAARKDDVLQANATLQDAKSKGNASDIAAARALVVQAQISRSVALSEVAARKTISDNILAAADPASRQRLTEISTELLTLSGREKDSAAVVKQLQSERADIEQRVAESVRGRVALFALEQAAALKVQNTLLATQLASEKKVLAAKVSQDPLELQLAEAQAQVDLGATRLKQSDEQAARDNATLQQTLSQVAAQQALAQAGLSTANGADEQAKALKNVQSITVERINLEAQLAEQTKNTALAHDLEKTKLEEARDALEKVRNIAEHPIAFAFDQAFLQFKSTALVTFTTTVSIMNGIVSSFASTVANLIVDAFDPTKKVDIKQRFGQFLQEISRMVLTELTKIAVAKAAVAAISLVGGFVGSFAEGGEVPASPISRAEGGPVPARGGPATRAHYSPRARGFALGGRPSWVDPRDTVAAWLRPHEFVIRPEASQGYGSKVMNAINNFMIDPGILHALADGAAPSISRTPSVPSFATGGSVTADPFGNRSDGQSRLVVQPVLVADNPTLEKLLHHGKEAVLDFMGEHATAVNSRLRRS